MNLNKLVKDAKVIAILCNQFGDTGKGKFSDYFASHWANITARGTGGNNAGHTVIINNKEKIFHLLPTGITYDSNGKKTILGNGMVIDLEVLCQELDELDKERMSYKNLMISKDAQVIMPYHIKRDKLKDESQEKGGIGTTGRGIGPCYCDKISRRGITIGDLENKPKLQRKIEKSLESYPEQEDLTTDLVIEKIKPFAERIKEYVRDTVNEIHKSLNNGGKILIEGAQGLLLSIEHGTYPYVTSSDCSLNGTASGVGLSAKDVDLPLGIVKFPFMTRVGAGPFPTELGGKDSENYCAKGIEHDMFEEAKTYLGMDINIEAIRELQQKKEKKDLEYLIQKKEEVKKYIGLNRTKVLELCNSEERLTQGIGIRLAALEYGATTSRPRRVGWTDAVAAKYAIQINGPVMILTKLDSLEGINKFQICNEYENGEKTKLFQREEKFLRGVTPTYQSYSGYKEIRDITEYDRLPGVLKESISNFEKFTRGHVAMISVGPEKEQTIIR